ncbi:MAG: hypothetical protein LEGION0398_MBIBDBAK_00870 [Legionellaceae bacterium]
MDNLVELYVLVDDFTQVFFANSVSENVKYRRAETPKRILIMR